MRLFEGFQWALRVMCRFRVDAAVSVPRACPSRLVSSNQSTNQPINRVRELESVNDMKVSKNAMYRSSNWVAWMVAVAVTATLLGGCGGTPKQKFGPHTLNLRVDDSLRDSSGTLTSVEVDVVGVRGEEAALWASKPVSEYFSGSDALRAAASKVTYRFTNDASGPRTLERTDPMWNTWQGAGCRDLYIIANLRGVDDAQRKISLNLKSIKGPPVIDFIIHKGLIVRDTDLQYLEME